MAKPHKTTAKPLERAIASALHAAAEQENAGSPWNRTRWTREVKDRIGGLREAGSFKVYCRQSDASKHGEWRFDLAWTKEDKDGFLLDVSLILECEWGNPEQVSADFQKLLITRSRYRVMICSAYPQEGKSPLTDRHGLLEEIRRCRLVQPGDRFMFAIYRGETKKFEVSYFTVPAAA